MGKPAEKRTAGGSSADDSGVASGAGAASGSDGASAELFSAELLISSDTSVASRSIVGGARFGRSESGSDPVSSDLSSTITAVPLGVGCRNLAESWTS